MPCGWRRQRRGIVCRRTRCDTEWASENERPDARTGSRSRNHCAAGRRRIGCAHGGPRLSTGNRTRRMALHARLSVRRVRNALGRGHAVCPPPQFTVWSAGAVSPWQQEVCGRLQRDQADRRRRHHHAQHADPRPDPNRACSGSRAHLWRGIVSHVPSRSARRSTRGRTHGCLDCSIWRWRMATSRHGGKYPLPILAAGHRDSAGRHGWQSRHRGSAGLDAVGAKVSDAGLRFR